MKMNCKSEISEYNADSEFESCYEGSDSNNNQSSPSVKLLPIALPTLPPIKIEHMEI